MMMYLMIGFAIVEALTFAAYRVEHGMRVSAQAEAKSVRLELSAYQTKQRDYVAKLVVEGTQAAAAADLNAKELDNARNEAIAKYENLAKALRNRAAPVDAGAIRLLNGAIGAASGSKDPTGTPAVAGESTAAATFDTGAWLDWSLGAVDQFKACTDQVSEFQSFYNRLRAAQE